MPVAFHIAVGCPVIVGFVAAQRFGLIRLLVRLTERLARRSGWRSPSSLLALDDALKSLAVSHPRESEIVELKFFGGLNAKEIGELLNVSTKTVLRDWQFAKAWLNRQLASEELYG